MVTWQQPGALNNAGLAFDMTYTRHYPLLHEVHVTLGSSLQATVRAIQRPQGPKLDSEGAAIRYFRGLTQHNQDTHSTQKTIAGTSE